MNEDSAVLKCLCETGRGLIERKNLPGFTVVPQSNIRKVTTVAQALNNFINSTFKSYIRQKIEMIIRNLASGGEFTRNHSVVNPYLIYYRH